MPDDAAVERELFEVGRRLAAALPTHAQPAEGARRQGDGPRVLGRRAQGRAVPLRRRRAGLPQPRRPGAPPDRLPGGGRRAAAAGRRGDEDGQQQGRVAARWGWRPRRASSTWRTASSSARTRRPRWATCKDLWKDGVASSVDLLGEATVTQAEAQRYADRCADALDTIRGRGRLAGAAAARARHGRAAAARQPVGQGLRVDAAAAPGRARARQARRRRPPAPAAAARS